MVNIGTHVMSEVQPLFTPSGTWDSVMGLKGDSLERSLHRQILKGVIVCPVTKGVTHTYFTV